MDMQEEGPPVVPLELRPELAVMVGRREHEGFWLGFDHDPTVRKNDTVALILNGAVFGYMCVSCVARDRDMGMWMVHWEEESFEFVN